MEEGEFPFKSICFTIIFTWEYEWPVCGGGRLGVCSLFGMLVYLGLSVCLLVCDIHLRMQIVQLSRYQLVIFFVCTCVYESEYIYVFL